MSEFNARAARAKRPCPIWVDAFQRDTQHLEADEIGAYFLLIMAMWTRETCDFPNDPSRLARVCRVSLRLWRARIGAAIVAFLTVSQDGSAVISKRLREEAAYVEGSVHKQSNRRKPGYAKPQGAHNPNGDDGGKYGKSCEINDTMQSTDASTEQPRHHPTQQPNNPTKDTETKVSVPKARKTQIVEGAICDDAFMEIGLAEGHDPPEVLAQFNRFRDRAIQHGSAYVNWHIAFRNWFRSEYFRKLTGDKNGNGHGGSDGRVTKGQQRLAAFIAGARGAP